MLWSPSVINPGLRQGLRMAVVSRMPARAPLLDAEGTPLIHPSPAWVAQVRPGRLAHPEETADNFATVTGLDDQQVLSVIDAAPQTHPLTLVTLSPSAYAKLRKKLGRVPGLMMRRVSLRLFDTSAADVTGTVGTELAPVLQAQGVTYRPGTTVGVSGLQQVYQRRLAGSAETEVIAENQAGHQVAIAQAVGRHQGHRGPHHHRRPGCSGPRPARSRASLPPPPSSRCRPPPGISSPSPTTPAAGPGWIRWPGATSRARRSRSCPRPPCWPTAPCWTSRFPACPAPGSAAGPSPTSRPCRASATQPLFSMDFAQSCGTAFTTLSQGLTGSRLASSATAFGLGAQWKLPLSAFSGSFRASQTQGGLAADTIGEQGVQVSPLAMALVAAGVDSGKWRPPVLVTSPPDPGLSPAGRGQRADRGLPAHADA